MTTDRVLTFVKDTLKAYPSDEERRHREPPMDPGIRLYGSDMLPPNVLPLKHTDIDHDPVSCSSNPMIPIEYPKLTEVRERLRALPKAHIIDQHNCMDQCPHFQSERDLTISSTSNNTTKYYFENYTSSDVLIIDSLFVERKIPPVEVLVRDSVTRTSNISFRVNVIEEHSKLTGKLPRYQQYNLTENDLRAPGGCYLRELGLLVGFSINKDLHPLSKSQDQLMLDVLDSVHYHDRVLPFMVVTGVEDIGPFTLTVGPGIELAVPVLPSMDYNTPTLKVYFPKTEEMTNIPLDRNQLDAQLVQVKNAHMVLGRNHIEVVSLFRKLITDKQSMEIKDFVKTHQQKVNELLIENAKHREELQETIEKLTTTNTQRTELEVSYLELKKKHDQVADMLDKYRTSQQFEVDRKKYEAAISTADSRSSVASYSTTKEELGMWKAGVVFLGAVLGLGLYLAKN